MKKIEQASKDCKEKSIHKQHYAVWLKELSRLNSLKRRNSAELDLHIRNGKT